MKIMNIYLIFCTLTFSIILKCKEAKVDLTPFFRFKLIPIQLVKKNGKFQIT